jgi:hypothetical protein
VGESQSEEGTYTVLPQYICLYFVRRDHVQRILDIVEDLKEERVAAAAASSHDRGPPSTLDRYHVTSDLCNSVKIFEF